MHGKFRRRNALRPRDDRLRRQIATEAARIVLATESSAGGTGDDHAELAAARLALAKRQAVCVLGQRVRESDLPTDAEVREQCRALAASAIPRASFVEPASVAPSRMVDHLDRYTIFRMRLDPLQEVRLNRQLHPEGDALFHSLQVFELARAERPHDEEFLCAALLHEIGRAIDPADRTRAALHALEGTIGERTAWLIEHLPEVLPRAGMPLRPQPNPALRTHPLYEDLMLLAQLDIAGRVPGARVPTLDEALDYIRAFDESENLADN